MDETLRTNQELYETLTNESQKELFKQTMEYEVVICPNCNTGDYISHFLVGRPSSTTNAIAELTQFYILGGCVMPDDHVNFKCRKCSTRF